MAKFTINKRFSETYKIEAHAYEHSDGWFFFTDAAGDDVFTIASSRVHTIERESESEE